MLKWDRASGAYLCLAAAVCSAPATNRWDTEWATKMCREGKARYWQGEAEPQDGHVEDDEDDISPEAMAEAEAKWPCGGCGEPMKDCVCEDEESIDQAMEEGQPVELVHCWTGVAYTVGNRMFEVLVPIEAQVRFNNGVLEIHHGSHFGEPVGGIVQVRPVMQRAE